jgi:ubiquinone/menaquinone biosynthesis C-methylase UbiE
VLDLGCGTGYLLRALARRYPDAERFVGVDAAPQMIPQMIAVAETFAGDDRLGFSLGTAERLGFLDDTFDLVVSTTSFDHWSDQQAGLIECARALRPGGHLVLVDQFSWSTVPTLVDSRRGRPAPSAAPSASCCKRDSDPHGGTDFTEWSSTR